MILTSAYILVLLSITGLVLTNPVQYTSSNEESENITLAPAIDRAEKTLEHYSHLISSDTDHLVYGILHVLRKDPTAITFIPYDAMDIVFKKVAEKLGYDAVETISKPILLSLGEKDRQPSTFKLTDETREKIEEDLDNFFYKQAFDHHM
ncbi:unnamed protein product [Rotaria socialis]|uniref:Uncharacterized protein n=1 Tax=Rotaria socialis TaxID=392032 RepID=A0A820YL60_9BILA|nr:unnamed protein product [Rotaria socialis]CAF4549367.1 unnamed protein product [Rotaria socialis]